MEPVSMAILGTTALTAAMSLFNAVKPADKAPGATPEQLTSYGVSRLAADRAKTSGGLSEQQYGRAERSISQQADKMVGGAMALGRQTMLSSPFLIESLANKAMAQSAGLRTEGLSRLLGMDVEAASRNLDKSLAYEEQAAARAKEIADAERVAFKWNQDLEAARTKAFIDTVVSGTNALVGVAGIEAAAAKAAAAPAAAAPAAAAPAAAAPAPVAPAPVAPAPAPVPLEYDDYRKVMEHEFFNEDNMRRILNGDIPSGYGV